MRQAGQEREGGGGEAGSGGRWQWVVVAGSGGTLAFAAGIAAGVSRDMLYGSIRQSPMVPCHTLLLGSLLASEYAYAHAHTHVRLRDTCMCWLGTHLVLAQQWRWYRSSVSIEVVWALK